MTGPERYHTVARVGEIAEGHGLSSEVEGRVVAVFLDDGVYYALDDACPHQGLPLCDGFVFDRTVTCTWHGWRFSLLDGRSVDGLRCRLGAYPVRVAGDEVQVQVNIT